MGQLVFWELSSPTLAIGCSRPGLELCRPDGHCGYLGKGYPDAEPYSGGGDAHQPYQDVMDAEEVAKI